ncbi:MAG: ferrous iron transport protein A [Firmicutes bacterium]|nr:ferrous iron transport protein A [Bacillota bacterium]
MPLTIADTDKTYTIKRIGGTSEVRSHLENLGFVVGGTVKVISTVGGNLIVNVKDARIALDRELAQKILV